MYWFLEGAHDAEEEVSLRELSRELIRVWEVLLEYRVCHGIGIQVLHGDLLEERNLHVVDLIGSQEQLGLR